YGTDRCATAAAISRATFATGVPVAYVATGVDYPDALAGVPAAGVQRGPVLLVRPTALPGATATELGRLKPQRIVILGGTGAVSAAVAAQLQTYTPSTVQRRSGADRYATAVAISRATFAPAVPQVFIATGRNYPDGLTGGPAAALRGGPLLLVPGTSLPSSVSAELLRLDPRRVTILGGTGAVSDEVRAQINALLNR
ncbi:MAG: cell wall-binding repeat-containing protein, partial [Candidatus Limnocylindria bacterium]